MSDTLREAINDWIDQAVVVNDYGAWLDADELRAILAAHPADAETETQCGWEWRTFIGGEYDRRATSNYTWGRPYTEEEATEGALSMNAKHPDMARVISRTAGPWQVSK